MRVAVTAVAAKKSGGSTLILEKLIGSLPRVAPEHHFRFFVSPHFAEAVSERIGAEAPLRKGGEIRAGDNVEVVPVGAGSQLRRLIWDQIGYRALLGKFGAEVSINALGLGPLLPGVPQCTVLQDSTYFCSMRSYQRAAADRARTEILRWLLLAVMQRSDRIVVPSQSLAEAVSKVSRRIAPKIVVVRDPFEAEYADPRERVRSGNRPQPGGEATILYLSHLEPHKAHSFLPDVAVELEKGRSISARFVVAIDRQDSPRLYDSFLRKIEATGTGDVFEIHSRLPQDEVAQLLARADVFFFPSVCESFGYPMAEAGAAGVPVVAAGTAVNREMLGEGALYYEPGRAEEAAEAVRKLIVDPGLRVRCASAIQRHQRSTLPGWDEYARQLVDVVVEAGNGSRR